MNLLEEYAGLIKIILVGVLVAALAFGIHSFLASEQQIGYDRAVKEYEAKMLLQQEAARKFEGELRNQIQEAQNESAKRNAQIDALAAAVSASSGGLRNAIGAYSNSLSSASADALRRSIDQVGGLLASCSDRYTGMAKSAEHERSEKQTLIDAWPSVAAPSQQK
jgi:hypothetical protein